MKTTINRKRYDSDKCEVLGEYCHYTYGAHNYAGTTYLVRASDGQLLALVKANGQSCHVQNAFYAADEGESVDFGAYEMTDEQACVDYGYITRVE